jgi:hypothetical protein
MKTAASIPVFNCPTNSDNAFSPPAEVPTTTTNLGLFILLIFNYDSVQNPNSPKQAGDSQSF